LAVVFYPPAPAFYHFIYGPGSPCDDMQLLVMAWQRV